MSAAEQSRPVQRATMWLFRVVISFLELLKQCVIGGAAAADKG
jgi:hypothetical protein